MADIHEDREYPYELIYHRITGTATPQTRRTAKPHMLSGRLLLADISALILVLSDSLNLKLSDLPEDATPLENLAGEYNVSIKTISRWRKRGLAGQRVIFPDGYTAEMKYFKFYAKLAGTYVLSFSASDSVWWDIFEGIGNDVGGGFSENGTAQIIGFTGDVILYFEDCCSTVLDFEIADKP